MNVKRLLLGTVLGTLATSSCTHVVLRPSTCEDRPEPTVRSAIGWQHVAGSSGLGGTVVAVSTSLPIVATQVVLRRLGYADSTKSRITSTDSLGTVAIDSLQEGKYLLAIRRIGYQQAIDTVAIVPGRRLMIRGVLAVAVTMLDGCGYAYFEKRVPWWIRK
jgi:hypothetical protein